MQNEAGCMTNTSLASNAWAMNFQLSSVLQVCSKNCIRVASLSREILISKIEPILDTYIKKNSISIVIDKKNMIGGLTKFDITNVIVERLNKELSSLDLQ